MSLGTGCLLTWYPPPTDGGIQDITPLAGVMKALVTRSVQRPGSNFRVGVLPPTQTKAMDNFLDGITSHLRSVVKKAAVMKVCVLICCCISTW